MMLSWFSCAQKKRIVHEIYFDAFVEKSILDEGEDGILHMIVDHTQAHHHQIQPPKSNTMTFHLLSRIESQPTSLLRTHYRYRFVAPKGSHVIEPLVVIYTKDTERIERILGEIFVDIDPKETREGLHDVVTRPTPSPYLPVWMVGGACALFMWYHHRKSRRAAAPIGLEEEFRSVWADIKAHETKGEKIALMLSQVLRRYLGQRFGVNIEHLAPVEFRSWVSSAPLRLAAKEAAIRISQTTEELRFAGMDIEEGVLLSLGGDLEVVFVREDKE